MIDLKYIYYNIIKEVNSTFQSSQLHFFSCWFTVLPLYKLLRSLFCSIDLLFGSCGSLTHKLLQLGNKSYSLWSKPFLLASHTHIFQLIFSKISQLPLPNYFLRYILESHCKNPKINFCGNFEILSTIFLFLIGSFHLYIFFFHFLAESFFCAFASFTRRSWIHFYIYTLPFSIHSVI